MVYGNDDIATILQSKMRRARRGHECTECRKKISIGRQYLYEVSVFDGSASTNKLCGLCLVMRKWLVYNCGGFMYGHLVEDFMDRNHIDERRREREEKRASSDEGEQP